MDSDCIDCTYETYDEAKPHCEKRLKWYQQAVVDGSVPADAAPSCLRRLGLLTPHSADSTSLVPVNVEVALAELMAPLEREIDGKRSELNDLVRMFDPIRTAYAKAKHQQENWITEITGRSLIASALERAVRSCEQELITVQPGGGRDPELLDEALERDLAVLRRGVRQRTLYQHSVRFHGPTLHYIGEIVRAGGEVRTLDEITERLIIRDRAVAFIPGVGDRESSALEIRHPAVVAFLVSSFERSWERATPVSLPDSNKHPRITVETQQAVLRLLVSGYTDEAIARRLGKSRRSVAGHVSRISEELGSRSRAQLGYLAATTGALRPDCAPRAGNDETA